MNPIDDIPIPVSKPKTFEELLEEEMRKGNGGGIVNHTQSQQKSPSRQKQTGTAVHSQKEFLKRRSQYKGIPTGRPQSQAKKTYKYYSDNFKDGQSPENR